MRAHVAFLYSCTSPRYFRSGYLLPTKTRPSLVACNSMGSTFGNLEELCGNGCRLYSLSKLSKQNLDQEEIWDISLWCFSCPPAQWPPIIHASCLKHPFLLCWGSQNDAQCFLDTCLIILLLFALKSHAPHSSAIPKIKILEDQSA